MHSRLGTFRGGSCRSLLGTATQRIEEAIERHTRISRDHLTPELQLHLLTPDCPLYNAKAASEVEYFKEPFWSIYWPGGQALARYILDEGPRLLAELPRTRVLDVGTGCGAAAIAAKLAGAEDVLANDIDEVACVAALKNARLNGVEIRASSADLLDGSLENPPEPFDLVLVGDLLYDEAMATRLETWLEERASPRPGEKDGSGATHVYLADPGRHGLTRELRRKLVHLRTYRLPENVRHENYGYDEAAVWKFLPRSLR